MRRLRRPLQRVMCFSGSQPLLKFSQPAQLTLAGERSFKRCFSSQPDFSFSQPPQRTLARERSLPSRQLEPYQFSSLREFIKTKVAVTKANISASMRTFGYIMVRPLGRGAFGQVYLVRDEETNEKRVIKVLDVAKDRREFNFTWLTVEEREQSALDSVRILEDIERLPKGVVRDHMLLAHSKLSEKLKREEDPQLRKTRRPVAEREILLRCANHPYISNLRSSFRDHQYLFMVFTYFSRGTLRAFIQRNDNRLQEDTARFYAAELLLALEFLAKNNIAHRDIKPTNVLLDRNGHLIVCDFGLSTKLQGGLKTFCGTAEYIAPEVLVDKSWSALYLDWWAFGVTLYEMLVGKTPFGAPTSQQVFINTIYAPLQFPDYLSEASTIAEHSASATP